MEAEIIAGTLCLEDIKDLDGKLMEGEALLDLQTKIKASELMVHVGSKTITDSGFNKVATFTLDIYNVEYDFNFADQFEED